MNMPFIVDPYSGMKLLELSHVWGHGVPSYPGQADVKMHRAVKHAEHGVLAWKCNTVMHTGTHMNAPINMISGGADLSQIPVGRFFGNGVVLDIPKGSFEVVTAKNLEAAGSKVRRGDVVVTDDILLAGRCIEKGARVITNRGVVRDANNIGEALAMRELMQYVRASGDTSGNQKPLDEADRRR